MAVERRAKEPRHPSKSRSQSEQYSETIGRSNYGSHPIWWRVSPEVDSSSGDNATECERSGRATTKRGDVSTESLLEAILSMENVRQAYRAVKRNQGKPGVDGITTDGIAEHLRQHWPTVRAKLLAGTYRPAPVRSVRIAKPDGGTRTLGIPTVQDRIIQQAIHQQLSPIAEPGFSDSSYGYRPGRSAQDAVRRAQGYVEAGKRWVVDIDISAFFDHVNHDILMHRVSQQVRDKRVLRLIGAYLRADIQQEGQVHKRHQGTPQGGPLSPLLANIYLDPLDKELERRGVSFVRYADDVAIYVGSQRSAERVLESTTRWIEKHLKLQVNRTKSGAGPTGGSTLLGFRIREDGRIAVAAKSLERYKQRVRELWNAQQGRSGWEVIQRWRAYVRGWWNYFAIANSRLVALSAWTRRHIRKWFWHRWDNRQGRIKRLRGLGLTPTQLRHVSYHAGAWRAARHPGMHRALSNRRLRSYRLFTPQDLAAA